MPLLDPFSSCTGTVLWPLPLAGSFGTSGKIAVTLFQPSINAKSFICAMHIMAAMALNRQCEGPSIPAQLCKILSSSAEQLIICCLKHSEHTASSSQLELLLDFDPSSDTLHLACKDKNLLQLLASHLSPAECPGLVLHQMLVTCLVWDQCHKACETGHHPANPFADMVGGMLTRPLCCCAASMATRPL